MKVILKESYIRRNPAIRNRIEREIEVRNNMAIVKFANYDAHFDIGRDDYSQFPDYVKATGSVRLSGPIAVR